MAGNLYRSRWRVKLELPEGPATLEVTTSARDSAEMVLQMGPDGSPLFPMGLIPQMVHNALIRTDTPFVPRGYDEFLDALIDLDELESGGSSVDPTDRAHSDA